MELLEAFEVLDPKRLPDNFEDYGDEQMEVTMLTVEECLGNIEMIYVCTCSCLGDIGDRYVY